MSTPSPSKDSSHARRVIVTLVITTAAAAVTAGVALQKRPHAEAVVEAADAAPTVAAGTAATAATAAPAATRREQWRDPWKRPAPLSASASNHPSPDAAMTSTDPSLPAAADALKGPTGIAAEPESTF